MVSFTVFEIIVKTTKILFEEEEKIGISSDSIFYKQYAYIYIYIYEICQQ